MLPVGSAVTMTSQGSWSGGSSTSVPTDIDSGSVTLPAANGVLQLRVTVGTASSEVMMLAYDTTAYPARITLGYQHRADCKDELSLPGPLYGPRKWATYRRCQGASTARAS